MKHKLILVLVSVIALLGYLFLANISLAEVLVGGGITIDSVNLNPAQTQLSVAGSGTGPINTTGAVCSNPGGAGQYTIPGGLFSAGYDIGNGTLSGNYNLNLTQHGTAGGCDNPTVPNQYQYSFVADVSSLANGNYILKVCADDGSGSSLCEASSFDINRGLAKIGVTPQVIIVCPPQCVSPGAAGVVSNNADQGSGNLDWQHSGPAYIGSKVFAFINQAFAAGSYISGTTGGLSGGTGLPPGGVSGGTVSVVDASQMTIGPHSTGSVHEFCISQCAAGATFADLAVEYDIAGPTVDIKANGSDGPITISSGKSVTLSWSSTNPNATSPVDSCSFGCATADGSQVVTPSQTTTYSIRVKGISDVDTDTSGANFATDSVLVCVDSCAGVTPAPTPSEIGTATPTPSGTVTPTPTITPTPTPNGLTCSPSTQVVGLSTDATLTASNGKAPYSWSAPGGIPSSGNTSSFTTRYGSYGLKTVTLTDSKAAQTTCTINVNGAPTASAVTATEPNYCTVGPSVTVGWTYSDPNNDSQSAYQVQVDSQGSSFNPPYFDSGKISSSNNSYFTGSGSLLFNTTYKARVRVWDANDLVSGWVDSGSWKTPKHAYPQVGFSWSPNRPPISQVVQFTDQTVFSDGGGGGNGNSRTWSWLFGDGGAAAIQNPAHSYVAVGNYNVTETATDIDNYSCSLAKILSVQSTIPIWKEVSPK